MFREFGIPARIRRCETVLDLLASLDEFNGKRNCYVSVYTFTGIEGKKVNYDSAVINTIWFDFDHNKDVNKCLKDVKKLYNRFCKPRGLEPRIYYTGGRGFQLNIDFPQPVDLPVSVKRQSIRDFLMHLKKKYTLTTLDEHCIGNSVSCMRRMPGSQYLDKQTYEPTGRKCIEISVDDLDKTMEEIEEMSTKEYVQLDVDRRKNTAITKELLFFVCDRLGIKHTPSNSEDYLLNEINKSEGFQPTTGYVPNMYRLEPRKCVMKMLNKCIDSGHSSHTQNNIIATELLNAGWKQDDIAFIFRCIYNEPAGDWGWYTDGNRAGMHIKNLAAKGINRYSKDRLIELKVCSSNSCC